MNLQPVDTFTRRYGTVILVTALLRILGVIDLVLTPIGVLWLLWTRVEKAGSVDGEFAAILVGVFIAGLTLGGVLVGLAALLRYMHPLARAADQEHGHAELDRPLASGHPAATDGAKPTYPPPTDSGMSDQRTTRETLQTLREIRDWIISAPNERESAYQRMRETYQRRVASEILDAINLRQLGRARAMLADAQGTYGSSPTLDKIADKLTQAASRNEPLDYTRTKRLVDQAAGHGRWVQAEEHARTLFVDHPDVPRCRRLWDETRRARLYAYVENAAAKRHWVEAQAACDEFLTRFPDSPEADVLRKRTEDLRHNAEIQQRKNYENRFRELIGMQEFKEALRIANHLVDQFPDSPQALALRPQIQALQQRVQREAN